jgi:hypothetical protein
VVPGRYGRPNGLAGAASAGALNKLSDIAAAAIIVGVLMDRNIVARDLRIPFIGGARNLHVLSVSTDIVGPVAETPTGPENNEHKVEAVVVRSAHRNRAAGRADQPGRVSPRDDRRAGTRVDLRRSVGADSRLNATAFHEERPFCGSAFGEEYRRYLARTGRFVSSIRKADAAITSMRCKEPS